LDPILLSGLIGALVGAFAALASQFLAHRLAEQRERRRFQVQSFERFRKEFSEDENLRRISLKKESLSDDEIDELVGFFEEIGLYFARNLVDIELVDEILGDAILNAWHDEDIRRSVAAVRAAEDDPSYFKYFERLARHLDKLKEGRNRK
jgi:hypothetical protein